jgi:hypothetical protein
MGELISPVSTVYAAGDDLDLQFVVSDDNGVVNISGFTCRFEIARIVGGTAVVSTETSPATATAELTTPASGVFTVSIPAESTELLLGTYYFEADVIDGNGKESTVSRGYMTFKPTQM